jgi:hypothetical protein
MLEGRQLCSSISLLARVPRAAHAIKYAGQISSGPIMLREIYRQAHTFRRRKKEAHILCGLVWFGRLAHLHRETRSTRYDFRAHLTCPAQSIALQW